MPKGPNTPEGRQRIAEGQRNRVRSEDERKKVGEAKRLWWAKVKDILAKEKASKTEDEV